jgi:hypothetical protein
VVPPPVISPRVLAAKRLWVALPVVSIQGASAGEPNVALPGPLFPAEVTCALHGTQGCLSTPIPVE